MRFSVRHETQYRYSSPVVLAPHVLRLTPRGGNAVLLTHRLTIDPEPSVRQDLTDRYGNRLTRLEFEGSTHHLCIESQFDLKISAPRRAGSCRAAASALAFRRGRRDGGLFAAGRP